MARGMNAADTRRLVERIKAGIPGVAFRTNFIVGFPGETEAEFEELCRYVTEESFDNVVVFAYEREPETPSYQMGDRVPLAVRRQRRSRLLALQQRLSRERLAQRIGERITVMVDGPAPGESVANGPQRWLARTSGMAWEVDGSVIVEGERLTPGALIPVRVTGVSAYDLFARAEASARDAFTILGACG
jgi:tRNA A37 methylthiotransferase MiaB